MGRGNQRQRQKGLWVAAADLPHTAAHPFYRRLNELLDEHGFDEFAEQRCEKFYAAHTGRPSLTPGSYFRCLLIGYLEGIDSERGIAWRLADSISLRRFLAIELDESTPDHSTISRTRRLIDVETYREVFTWVLQLLARQGLLKAGTIAVDATTLEANAALRSIVRRDSGEAYEEFLRGLAAKSGIAAPTRQQLAKLDKKRKKQRLQQGLDESTWPRRQDHKNERRAHGFGAQGRGRLEAVFGAANALVFVLAVAAPGERVIPDRLATRRHASCVLPAPLENGHFHHGLLVLLCYKV